METKEHVELNDEVFNEVLNLLEHRVLSLGHKDRKRELLISDNFLDLQTFFERKTKETYYLLKTSI